MEFSQLLVLIAAAFIVLAEVSLAEGKKDKSPFHPGTVEFSTIHFSPKIDGSPLYTTMYYPKEPGLYAPIFFLGGIYDLISTKYYRTFLQDIAKHGYIVFGIDLFSETKNFTDIGTNKMPKTILESHMYQEIEARKLLPNFLEQMKWLERHVTKRTKAMPEWEKLTLSCQSASCSIILSIVRSYPKYAAAAIFLDPVCFNSKMMKPKKVHTRTLTYVSSKSFNFPFCCVRGFGYKKVYDLMTGIKVRMSVRDFGHCGLMEMNEWSMCQKTGVCKCGAEAQVTDYQQFTASMMHAFIRWTLYNQLSMRRYVIHENLMPLALDDLDYVLHPHLNVTKDLAENKPSEDIEHVEQFVSTDRRFTVV